MGKKALKKYRISFCIKAEQGVLFSQRTDHSLQLVNKTYKLLELYLKCLFVGKTVHLLPQDSLTAKLQTLCFDHQRLSVLHEFHNDC